MIDNPPLRPLHLTSSLSQAKLNRYARLTTEQLKRSLEPDQEGALKTRPDGTIVDGHHRVEILRRRGVDVNELPRRILFRKRI
jgi:hypothetical protein